MKKILFASMMFFALISLVHAGETTGTITTGVSTSGLEFSLPCSPASVSNGSVNAKTCAITCNSGYNLSGSSCVKPSSGWGWGGWGGGTSTTPTCSIAYLECKQSVSGEYKYYVKSGMTCTAWELSKPCTPGSTSSSSSWGTLTPTQTLSGVTNTLQNTYTGKTLQTYISQVLGEISNGLDVPKLEIYATFDADLKAKYQELLDTYKSMVKALDMYSQTKEKSYLTQVQDLQKKYKALLQDLQNLDGRYIQKVMVNNVELYKSLDPKLLVITDKIEKIVLKKLNKKLLLRTITQQEYARLVSHYNYFVLQVNIYKKFGIAISKQEAKTAFLELIKAWL